MNLSKEQLRILRHMLGINTPNEREPKPYRDHYCAAAGDEKMAELAKLGAVKKVPCSLWSGDYYVTTLAGWNAAMESFKTIRRSASKRRYAKFLDVSDAFTGLTFKEFLTNPRFKETRENA